MAGKVVKKHGALVGVDMPRLRQLATESREKVLERANVNPKHVVPVELGGHWHPPIQGFTANAVNPQQ